MAERAPSRVAERGLADSAGQEPFADVLRFEGGFSIPRLKWRELLFVGALREDGDRWVRDPDRPLPPFRIRGLFPEGVRFRAESAGERVRLYSDSP